ncbi:MAG TPA: MarR family winged helix-turn-helix transcriptional regulator [Hyphomicrobiaceae bacterium]|nr:MarR family winged helix-turn-helix transcriptional regulator [Hyphomicrobiaceae bacterium]
MKSRSLIMDHNSPTLGFLLHDVARLLRKRFEQNARESGLTRSQWQVLAYLAQNEGINQSGLAELLDIEPITLGRIVDKLQALKLIERHPHPTDRRVWTLRLTPAAQRKISEARKIGDATRAEALVGLSSVERQQLVNSLQVLKSNLVAACDRPAVNERRAQNG